MGLGGQCEKILVAATQMVSVIGPGVFLHSAEWVFDTKQGGTAGDGLSLTICSWTGFFVQKGENYEQTKIKVSWRDRDVPDPGRNLRIFLYGAFYRL